MGDKNNINWKEAVEHMREHSRFLKEDIRQTSQVIRVSLSDVKDNFNSIRPVFKSLVSCELLFVRFSLLRFFLQVQPVTNMARSKDLSPVWKGYERLRSENPVVVQELKSSGFLVFFFTSVSSASPHFRPMRGIMWLTLYTFWTIHLAYPTALKKAIYELFRKNQNS